MLPVGWACPVRPKWLWTWRWGRGELTSGDSVTRLPLGAARGGSPAYHVCFNVPLSSGQAFFPLD